MGVSSLLGRHVLRRVAHGDRAAASTRGRRAARPPAAHASSTFLRPLDVHAVERLGVLGLARDLPRAVERARRSPPPPSRTRASVEHVARRSAARERPRTRARAPPATATRCAPEKARGARDEVPSRRLVQLEDLLEVMSSATSFDLMAPDMKSAGLGTYASRTIFVKISGLVLSTQSAVPPSGLPGRTWQRRAVDAHRPLRLLVVAQREVVAHRASPARPRGTSPPARRRASPAGARAPAPARRAWSRCGGPAPCPRRGPAPPRARCGPPRAPRRRCDMPSVRRRRSATRSGGPMRARMSRFVGSGAPSHRRVRAAEDRRGGCRRPARAPGARRAA